MGNARLSAFARYCHVIVFEELPGTLPMEVRPRVPDGILGHCKRSLGLEEVER